MTRKHFEMVASAIRKIENLHERRKAAELNATIFAKANPRFNRVKFFTACNVSDFYTL